MTLKNSIVVILLLSCTIVKAQTNIYHPFPDSSAIWTEQASSCCGNGCPGLPFFDPIITDYTFSYFLSGDTVVNGFTYNRIYKSGFSHEHCLLGSSLNNWNYFNNDYVGGLRQDTSLKTVYFIDDNGNECLLYDFNLSIGDTVKSNCLSWGTDCAVVISIDSLFAISDYRKVFNLSTIPPYSIIEGIGSTSGLLEPLCPNEFTGTLVCFTEGGTTLYPDALTACEIVSNTEEGSEQLVFKAYPNPVKEKVTIQMDSEWNKSNWQLYNAIGEKVRTGQVQTPAFEITRNALPSGIYLLHLVNEKGKSATHLLVME